MAKKEEFDISNEIPLIVGALLIIISLAMMWMNKYAEIKAILFFIGAGFIVYYFFFKSKRKFIPLHDVFSGLGQRRVETWLDKLTYPKIFLIWMITIVTFGFIYHFFSNDNTYLIYSLQDLRVNGLLDSLYFSFITATTTGFGDIIPLSYFKVVAIIEVVFGLVLFALVTSKLVSMKQDIILSEVYEISFHERLNRLRSTMIVFRQNLLRLSGKVEDKSISMREIAELYNFLYTFENVLNEVSTLFMKKGKRVFIKVIDSINAELLFNNILMSFERLDDLLRILNENKIEWRRKITLNLINDCIDVNDTLFLKLSSSKILSEKNIQDLKVQKTKVIDSIKKRLKH